MALIRKDSTASLENFEKSKEEAIKKRVSITSKSSNQEETNFKNSLYHLQESIQSINFPHPISFQECNGIDDVIITPSYMEFKDGSEGNTMEQMLTIQNFGNKAAIIKIMKPNSMTFEINTILKNGYRLCPGLSLNRLIRYTFKQSSSLHAMIPIEINGVLLDYHLICTMSFPHISVEPTIIDFGYVDVNSVSDIRMLTVTNEGGKSARFCIDVGMSSLPLKVHPAKGLIKPNDKIMIAIQVTAEEQGFHQGQFWIKSNPNIHILMTINVIEPKLIFHHPTMIYDSLLLNFPVTFLETRRFINVPLQNYSSQQTSFVLMIEHNGHLKSIQEINEEEDPNLDAFRIYPCECTLEPFEDVMFTIFFCPTKKRLRALRDRKLNYFTAIIRVCIVQVYEARDIIQMEPVSHVKIERQLDEVFVNDHEEKKVIDENIKSSDLTLYVYGQIEIPKLDFIPNELYLGDLNIDETIQRVIGIINPSEYLSLTFDFVPKPCIKCKPNHARLRPTEKIQVLIIINVKFNLESSFKLEFDVSATSYDISESSEMKNVIVSRDFIPCTYNPLKAHGRIKSCKNLCKIDSYNKLQLEPDYSLTYTTSEYEMKMNHREFWTHYFRTIFSHKSLKLYSNNAIKYEDVSYHTTAIPKSVSSIREPLLKLNNGKYIPLCLTPMNIYKIRVSPMKLDFGKVVINTKSRCHVELENGNNFKVKILFISLNTENITFPEGNSFVIKPRSTKICAIEFSSQHYENFNSYLHYEINDSYKYQLPINAIVVRKTLQLKTKEVIFDKETNPQEGYRIPFKIIEIENKLNSDTRFVWNLPENVNFKIEPVSGTVPSNGYLFGCVYQDFDTTNLNRGEAILQMEGGSRTFLKMESSLRSVNVVLLNDTLDIEEIPLNIEYQSAAILYNTEYSEVFFEIDEKSLFKGIKITPNRGTISSRSVQELQIILKFDTCIEAAITVDIIVQKRQALQLKLNFSVNFPKLRLEPNEIRLRKVCSNSYRVEKISATNLTNTEITIRFLFKDYPEFHIAVLTAKEAQDHDKNIITRIAPRSTIELFLHFQPYDLAYYSFDLPIVINELLSYETYPDSNYMTVEKLQTSENQYSELTGITLLPIHTSLPKIYIECTVTHPIVCFNKLEFNFNVTSSKDEFRICNISEDEVSVVLLTASLMNSQDCPFRINWLKGVKPKCTDDSINCLLLPKEQIRFEVSFKSKEPGRFIFEIPILIGECEDENFYNILILEGLSTAPCLCSDISEIHLIPLPIGVSTTEKFYLTVYNFSRPTCLRAKVRSPEKCIGTFNEKTLKIHFPDGDSINPSCLHEIAVEISFESEDPVSFCTEILFMDTEGTSSVAILIFGTANDGLSTRISHAKKLMMNFCLTKQTEKSSDNLVDDQNKPADELSFRKDMQTYSNQTSLTSSASKNEMHEERKQSEENRKSSLLRRIEDSNSNLALNLFDELLQPLEKELDSTEIEKLYMHESILTINRWLYATVFKYQFYPKLADQLSITFSKVTNLQFPPGNDKKEKQPELPSFIDILKNLMKSNKISDVNDRIELEENENDDELDRCNRIINFLLTKGTYVAHISPKFLLNYDKYKEIQKVSDYTLQEAAFQFRSKYSWLELLLQIYNCFVLSSIDENLLKTHHLLFNNTQNHDIYRKTYGHHDSMYSDIIKRTAKYNKFPKSEKLLSAWLEYHHTRQFYSRIVTDFEDCFSDGLFFIAVTLSYCPFLRNEFFKNIYLKSNTFDQKIHNTICLVSAWKKIRLGFIITPSEIVKPHPLRTLMLSIHLFLNLSTYLIKDKIIFECPLTKSVTETIKLSIPLHNQMNFVAQFFGNDFNLFSSKQIITIHPRKIQQVKVTFSARKIQKTEVFLVLCGSAIGPYFAENQTFLLEGFPNEIEISEEHILKSKLYQNVIKNLEISVPYDYNTDYEIWMTEERPHNLDELKISRSADLQANQMFSRLVFLDNIVSLQEESETITISVMISCLTPEARSFWIFFRSELADFVIQITSKCQNSVTDNLSLEIEEAECICSSSEQVFENCPLSRKISIPSKNTQLLNCLVRMFMRSLTSEDKLFWTKHLDNSIGIGFILWLIQNTQDKSSNELKHIFDPTVVYDVESNRANLLILPKSVTVEGGWNSIDEIKLLVHITRFNSEMTDALITLTSLDKMEVRVCRVDFIYEKSTDMSSRSTLKSVGRNKTKRRMTIL